LKRAKRLNPVREPGPLLPPDIIARIEALDLEPSCGCLTAGCWQQEAPP
jgi:hypothetical protein